MLGLACLLAANAGVTAAAWKVSRCVATGKPALDLLLLLLIRLMLISAAVLAFGLCGALRPVPLGVAGLAALAILVRKRTFEGFPLRLPPLTGPWKALALLLAVRLALQVWVFTPYLYDATSYHLPKVASWVQAGALSTDLGPDPRAWFPAGFELVEAWWAVFLHHDVLIEMAGIEFLLLGALGVAALALRLGLDATMAAKSALLYALVPGLHLGATACINDAPAAGIVVAVFALVLNRVPWTLAAAALAFGVGIKPTVLYAAPGVALLWWLERRLPASPIPRPALAGVLLGLACAVGSFWYFRNLWIHGSPIYPIGWEGYVNERGDEVQKAMPSPAGLLQSLRALARTRLNDAGPISPMLLYMAGWGAVAVSAGLVGVVKECQARPEMRRLTAAFAVSLGSVLLMSLPDPWNLRFVLFFPALLGIAALRLVEGRRTLQWLLAAGIGVQVLSTMAPAEFGVGEIRDRLGVSWQRRWTRLIPHDPWSTDRIAAGPAARRTYLLYRPDFSARVVTVLDDDPDGFARRLRESGAKVVHADPTHPVIRACLQRRHLRAEPGNFFSLEPR